MSIDANKALVRRYWLDLWNGKQGGLIDEICAPDMRLHFAPGQSHQPPSMQVWFEHALIAFPDVYFTIHAEIAEGDLVTTRWSYTATQTGEFLGLPPSGKKITDTGIDIFRVQDGKLVDLWIMQDSLGLMQQLGAIEVKAKKPSQFRTVYS